MKGNKKEARFKHCLFHLQAQRKKFKGYCHCRGKNGFNMRITNKEIVFGPWRNGMCSKMVSSFSVTKREIFSTCRKLEQLLLLNMSSEQQACWNGILE